MISVHWIPTHRGTVGDMPDKDIFARWQPPFMKIVCIDEKPPYTEDVPPDSMIVIRNHPMSEQYGARGLTSIAGMRGILSVSRGYEFYFRSTPDNRYGWALETSEDTSRRYMAANPASAASPEQIGREHAAACDRMAFYLATKGIARSRLLFEGLNEPQLWANEPPDLTARYYREFLLYLHSYSLHGVVGNFGVGWPGNGGVQDAPVEWDFFRPVIDIFERGDYLGLHEYWNVNGPAENWRWWGGRFLQCPYDVPILITECGVDTGVVGQWYGGWRDMLPGASMDDKARRYCDDLYWYAHQCAADGRIKGIFPFTYDIGGREWEKFDIRDVVWLQAFWNKLAAEPLPQPGTPIPPPAPPDPPTPPIPPTPGGSMYKIIAVVTDSQPNPGMSYILGSNFMVDSSGNRVKPMQKPVEIKWEGETDPAYYIYPIVAEDGSWSFTPSQSDLKWLGRAVDPVQGIDSGWHLFDLNQRQMSVEYRWTPVEEPEPEPEPGNYLDHIRNMAWINLGIPYNPQAAFPTYAREHGLGNPVTEEFDTVDGYRAQGFAGAIVYAAVGDWANVKALSW